MPEVGLGCPGVPWAIAEEAQDPAAGRRGDEASADLKVRAGGLTAALATLDEALARSSGTFPRVAMLETEYQRAVMAAELAWVSAVVDELRSGALTWTEADCASAAEAHRAD